MGGTGRGSLEPVWGPMYIRLGSLCFCWGAGFLVSHVLATNAAANGSIVIDNG